MSCLACNMFEPNSDYIWERHVLKLLADGQVVFSKIFNFLHYLPDGIGSKWVKCIEVPIWKTVFITCLCYLYKLTPTIFFKLVNLVLVMRPLTDHVYFVGIVSKNWPNLLQHAMHIAIFSLNSLAMFCVKFSFWNEVSCNINHTLRILWYQRIYMPRYFFK